MSSSPEALSYQEPRPSSEARLNYFDGLRGIAAVGVALAHFSNLYDFALTSGRAADAHFGFEKYVAGGPLSIPIQGNFMVQIFFVLSGYVLPAAFLKNTTFLGAFMRRYARLVLPILVSCLFAWSLNLAGWNYSSEILIKMHSSWLGNPGSYHPAHLLMGAVLHQAFYGVFFFRLPLSDQLNTVLWTMPIEFSGSVLIMIFVLSVRSRSINYYTVLFLLTLVSWGYYQFFMLCGVWLFLLREKGYTLKKVHPVVWIALFALAILLASYPGVPEPGRVYRWISFEDSRFIDLHFQQFLLFIGCNCLELCHGIAAVILVLFIISSEKLQALFGKFTFLGKISFPLYLIHIPILFFVGGGSYYLMDRLFHNSLAACLCSFLVFASVTVALSWFMYLFVEMPAVQFSKRVGRWVDHFVTPEVR